MNYQRKTLPNENWGYPGELPADLAALNLTDDQLADLTTSLGAQADLLGYAGQGFFRIADTIVVLEPASPYDFLMLFTSAERQGILQTAANNYAIADWLNLLNHVDSVHFDDINTITGVKQLEAAGLIGVGRADMILSRTPPG